MDAVWYGDIIVTTGLIMRRLVAIRFIFLRQSIVVSTATEISLNVINAHIDGQKAQWKSDRLLSYLPS